ncbi:MAG: iron-containing alcohol dehydrogenase, partial [Chthoniobacterales bacterium]
MHNARRIAIRGGEHRYEAIVGARLLPEVATLLPKQLHSRSCALVCDETTARLYGEAVAEMLRAGGSAVTLITVAPGEEAKSLENVATICDQMARANLDRSSFLIGLGGGVIGDLSGFVAATFHRGISHVQVPTTLLAMVDSSIGGKTGVNSHAAKNLIGAIHHPALIVADVETLR